MEFMVDGDPIGKARPRFSHRTGTVYTPGRTMKYEKKIRAAFIASDGKKLPSGCYASISVYAYFGVPKSYSRKKRNECLDCVIRPAKKPDIDNILKAVLDALNGFAYDDDRQVVSVTCRKFYAAHGCILIRIREEKA